jgi:hypothetical protein
VTVVGKVTLTDGTIIVDGDEEEGGVAGRAELDC